MTTWQPIDSVPLDHKVMIYVRGHMYPARAYKLCEGVVYDSAFFTKFVKPSHWREIPYDITQRNLKVLRNTP